jgi:hypothetical protein
MNQALPSRIRKMRSLVSLFPAVVSFLLLALNDRACRFSGHMFDHPRDSVRSCDAGISD